MSAPLQPSMLQPRMAAALNVPRRWHPWLFALRLASVLPALCWGMPTVLQILVHLLPPALQQLLHMLPGPRRLLIVSAPAPDLCADACSADPAPYGLMEGALATIWIRLLASPPSPPTLGPFSSSPLPSTGGRRGRNLLLANVVAPPQCFASGYLSFFFTDCLMSRWLINYTPQATIVRLLTIDGVNAYLTLSVLSLTGGFDDPRLILPGWISIATTLTVCYHITHQKISIRKETITSVNVFSIASYITMVTLLIRLHSTVDACPTMPIAAKASSAWRVLRPLLARLTEPPDGGES